jgi:Putative peptidoglycan binding domain/D-alanyl-D-alanine carboxypeptidase
MATSQNGWRAGSRADANVATFRVPGYPNVLLPINRDAAPALLAMARWWFDNVEKPVMPGCWGWANRLIKGGTQTSNHASGTAIDLNAPNHPLGKRGTVPANKRAAIAAKAAQLGLRWGGTYTGRADEMHFEVNVSPARMAAISGAVQRRPGAQKAGGRPTVQLGSSGRHVRDLQAHLKSKHAAIAGHLVVDGEFGPKTNAAVRAFQQRSGLVVDGIVGPATWAKLGI